MPFAKPALPMTIRCGNRASVIHYCCMDYLLPIFLALWLVFVWVGLIWVIRLGWRTFKKDYFEARTRTKAKVVAMDDEEVFLTQIQEQGHTYEIAFECQDGKVMVYDVPERLYRHVSIGTEGVLVRQGSRFIEFEGPAGASEGEDDIFRRLVRR